MSKSAETSEIVLKPPIHLNYYPEKTTDELSKAAYELFDKYLRALGEISSTYPTNDVRYRFFDKMLFALYSLHFNYSIITGVYMDIENREKLLLQYEYSSDILEDKNGYFLQMICLQAFFSFFHYAFSCIESNLRILVTHLDVPEDRKKIKQGSGPIENIITFLFDELMLSYEYKEALYFLRLARDTIHNRGTFNPIDGLDKTITYKGNTYYFIVGKQIDFINWKSIFPVFSDLVGMYQEIIKHHKVNKIGLILDPYM